MTRGAGGDRTTAPPHAICFMLKGDLRCTLVQSTKAPRHQTKGFTSG